MFNHIESPVIQELNTIQKNGKRYYVTPDGNHYPSVTTVIGETTDKSSLIEWRKRVGEAEANRISGQAATRGTAVHKMCEDYLNNIDPYKDQMPSNVDTFNSLKDVIDTHIGNVHCQEAPLYSNFLQVAGRVDCIAEYDNKLSIIDFKTSRKPKRAEWIQGYFMQTSAYAVMYEEMTEIPINQLVVLIAVDNDWPQVFIERRDDHIGNFISHRQKYKELYGV
jgi:genome maintenance exonuclease 1